MNKLEYSFKNIEEKGSIRYPKGHSICNECQSRGTFELIEDIALPTHEEDSLVIAELLMSHLEIPFFGYEYALITTSSHLAALNNEGL
ncbi:MAG: hypothetical protein NWE87_05045 [Candidatus Bathyarchaeota archaeon]|nr:hypothetical protein [Candidatus Bathyarchaeota archaeon]